MSSSLLLEIYECRQAKRDLRDKIYENDFFLNSNKPNLSDEFDTKMTAIVQL